MHSVALRKDGRVVCWGDNSFGQLDTPNAYEGDGDESWSGENEINNIKDISAGYFHTLALDENGRVYAWGENTYGQCNVPAEALENVIAISAGQTHSMAIKADGSLIIWGGNLSANGDVEVATRTTSQDVYLTAISAGGYHSLGLIPSHLDDNQNGIPDWWEIQHELVDSTGSGSDADNDGFSDLEEYLSDTNPNDHDSNFEVHIANGADQATCEVQFGPISIERYYTIEYASNLGDGNWQPVAGYERVRKDASSETVKKITVRSLGGSETECRIFRVSIVNP